ncbi:olfactory receptor 6X1-like [Hemicordylus capensis]|uniref:olfactory receptor 6X1-like n=1 Tax=Hemicordylus capensis TaxID=884348 RepID=UPI00230425A9|nr:olfactory receptor 6X1-like [Hemicordylus capensis]
MDLTNCSRATEFILLGFPHIWGMNITLFVVVLLLYILSIAGNGLIIVMVGLNHQLQKPMYFFLSNLSFLEMWYTTAVVPKMLANLLSAKTTICFYCCMAQSYFHFLFGITEFYILTAMSFDRYLAICQPLRYNMIMTTSVCLQLALAAWFGGFFTILLQTILVVRLPFCGSNIVNHFYCDIGPMLKIAGGDTHLIEALGFLIAVAVILTSLLLTVVSYIFIISTILRIPSSSGQQKAFSTCASHLTVVSIFYGAVLFIYLRPTAKHSSFSLNKAISVLNTVITPVLNPFIYTIRNNDVKQALRKTLKQLETISILKT